MELQFIKARDLPDAWFQCVYEILDHGQEYVSTGAVVPVRNGWNLII